jgi:hypothetical protein
MPHKTVNYFFLESLKSLKMTVFCDVAPRSLVEVYRRFRGPCCLHRPYVTLNFVFMGPV